MQRTIPPSQSPRPSRLPRGAKTNDPPRSKSQPTGPAEMYPMRINKYLAHKGHSTRRGADELIERGVVFINGVKAVLGSKVMGPTDNVEVRTKTPDHYVYFAYHKPLGVITHSPQGEEEDIRQHVAKSVPSIPKDIFPIGRLDKHSSGLIILTNDGRITDRLLNPEYQHEKEYVVRTREKLRDSFKKNMERGVSIENYTTKPCKVFVNDENVFTVQLTEGKKHQIRRMVVALHNDVVSLKRTRIMNVKLGSLEPGAARPIAGEELATFLKEIGL